MHERKKTVVHGTLEIISLAWKFNSKQLLCTTLNSRMNIIETRAVLIIVHKDGKRAPEAKREGLKLIQWPSEHRVSTDKFPSSGP